MAEVDKLYCYVDETGQDTNGKFFLVAIVLKEQQEIETLEKRLFSAEQSSGKHLSKWQKTNLKSKIKYLALIRDFKELRGALFYSIYLQTKNYTPLVAFSVAKTILSKPRGESIVSVIIDGLNDKNRDIVRKELKKLRIRYKQVRGMKDEQNVFLRLADALAGFLRDASELQEYTKPILADFKKTLAVSEI